MTDQINQRRLRYGSIPVALLFLLMVVSLILLGEAAQNSEQFEKIYIPLLITNLVGVIILLASIVFHVVRLVRNYRARVIGSRLAVRMVMVFVVISAVPVILVYYFSMQFLQHGIDSWFNTRLDGSLKHSLELSQGAINVRSQELLRQSTVLLPSLKGVPPIQIPAALKELRIAMEAVELSMFSAQGRILAYSVDGDNFITPHPLESGLLDQAIRNGRYAGLDPVGDDGLLIRILLPLPAESGDSGVRMLQVLYPIPSHLNDLAKNINDTYAYYKQLNYLRDPLKTSFSLTLSVVLLQVMMTAIWLAFYSAQRLVEPIRVLATGTRSVAEGHYHHKLPLPSNDEFGMLVQSFNDMTARIASARDEVQRSQQQAERERAYLGAVLGGLSSGVLTLDRHLVLRTANVAAAQILQAELEKVMGEPLVALSGQHPYLLQLVELIQDGFSAARRDWAQQLVLFGPNGRKALMCRGAALPGQSGQPAGFVVVFDEITAMIQAQRDAAWAEVARRLAHEIKNPLTPIQLSAERLRRKYLGSMDEKEAELLDRATHTIIQQVQAMEEMVKAFSDYAYSPTLQRHRVDVNALVRDVVELYRGDTRCSGIEMHLDPSTGELEADAGRLRQLLHNLLKNALEAMADSQSSGVLSVFTQRHDSEDGHYIELRVQDSGPGIPQELLERLFEPYVTSKPKGTGLGLAIVKKIVEEHGGMAWVENLPNGKGAAVILRLPLVDRHSPILTAIAPNHPQ